VFTGVVVGADVGAVVVVVVVVVVVGADFDVKLVGIGCGIVVVIVIVDGIASAVRFNAMACTTFAILSSLSFFATLV
jgi:hypothetical protein